METSYLLRLFIMQLIDKHKLLDNGYSLTRFFAKSSVLPDKLYSTIDDLQQQGFIQIKEIKNQVEYYALTNPGIQFLKENYSLALLKAYLHDIEETDYFISIWQKIESLS